MENILTTGVPFNETSNLNHFVFGWVDYTFFVLVLLVSLIIGIYFGFYTKQDSSTEYFLGGRRMKRFPIALSSAASNLSGVSLLGVPTEVYLYGTQYAAVLFPAIFSYLVNYYIFFPVFYKLKLTSVFEYLEVRFTRSVRILVSLIFTISIFIYVPVVIYAPALVFAQVTDLNLHVITPLLCISCIIYTAIGGFKAVVWTDTLQITIALAGLLMILGLGIVSIGDFGEVWRIAGEGNRLVFFDMNPSPFVRNSFWIMIFGYSGTWIGHLAFHPGMVQRYMAVPTYKDAIYGVMVPALTIVYAVQIITLVIGLVMYAKYYDCDPTLTKTVQRPDQIMPYYVMDVAGHLVGFPGLFLACLVSSALAVMSTSLNTMSGTLYEDFIRPWLPGDMHKENIAANFMKAITVICGLLTVGLVFMVEKLGTIFEMGISMRAISDGPLTGIYFLGIMVPWANAKGALTGGCFGLVFMSWMVGSAQWNVAHGRIKYNPLPTSMDGCPFPLNETISMATTMTPIETDLDDKPMILFRITFLYFATIGALVVIVVGTVASYFFGVDLENVNPDHITPCMKRFLPPRKYTEISLRETPSFETPERGHFSQ